MKKSFTIHDFPKSERPRERLQKFGEKALSLQELLALIISRGISGKSVMNIAQDVLTEFKSVKAIREATIEQLCTIKGIGVAKSCQIKASFELGKREELDVEIKDFDIKNPEAVVKVIRASIKDKAKEHFKLIILNSRNRIIGITNISVGTLNASLVHPREIFKDAISHNAASVVLVHNHPSGDPEPSEGDLVITNRLVEAGRILEIAVVDHIIVTNTNFLSFRERKLL